MPRTSSSFRLPIRSAWWGFAEWRARRVPHLLGRELAVAISIGGVEDVFHRRCKLLICEPAVIVCIVIRRVPVNKPTKCRTFTDLARGIDLRRRDDRVMIPIVLGGGELHVCEHLIKRDDTVLIGIQLRAMHLQPWSALFSLRSCLRVSAVCTRLRSNATRHAARVDHA